MRTANYSVLLGSSSYDRYERCVATCSLQTAEEMPSSLEHPSTSVAIFGQSGQSHQYSLTLSSFPSGPLRPVLIVILGKELS
jgi:hypothetical protein